MGVREQIVKVRDSLRANVANPDDRESGAVWTWKLDEWADELDAILSAVDAQATQVAAMKGEVLQLFDDALIAEEDTENDPNVLEGLRELREQVATYLTVDVRR